MHSARLNNDLARLAASEVENMRTYKAVGARIFDEVAKIVRKFSAFRITRQVIAGSIGKKTSLGYDSEPDFDVVLFVKDYDAPTLKPVVEEFYSILHRRIPTRSEHWTKFDSSALRQTPNGVGFTVETWLTLPTGSQEVTISFDLLPAYDLSSDKDEQTRLVLGKIQKLENPEEDWYVYSSSLCEKTVQFVEDQPQFVHQVIRLAKLWDKKLKEVIRERGGKTYISGRSSIIELVAIRAAISETDGNILSAFRQFLACMEDIDHLHVNFYDGHVHRPPMIKDSVNPVNNYAKGIRPIQKVYFKLRASRTLAALIETENGPDYDGKHLQLMKFFT